MSAPALVCAEPVHVTPESVLVKIYSQPGARNTREAWIDRSNTLWQIASLLVLCDRPTDAALFKDAADQALARYVYSEV